MKYIWHPVICPYWGKTEPAERHLPASDLSYRKGSLVLHIACWTVINAQVVPLSDTTMAWTILKWTRLGAAVDWLTKPLYSHVPCTVSTIHFRDLEVFELTWSTGFSVKSLKWALARIFCWTVEKKNWTQSMKSILFIVGWFINCLWTMLCFV